VDEHKVDFAGLAWLSPAPGMREKVWDIEGKRLRLVEFSSEFVEEDWCRRGHVGCVLAGEMEIDFSGRKERYSTGDGIFILPGEEHRHKARVIGERVRLFLVEEA